jgi:hypothetical protein
MSDHRAATTCRSFRKKAKAAGKQRDGTDAGHLPNLLSSVDRRSDGCGLHVAIVGQTATIGRYNTSFARNEVSVTEEIIRKLTAELDAGIETEVQVVYLLVGIRKLMERDDRKNDFPSLLFHCDWVVHPQMDRAPARSLLRQFDELQGQWTARDGIARLPEALQREIDDITQMRGFRKELNAFLQQYRLPALTPAGPEGWTRFLNLYARVVADIPLVVKPERAGEFRHVERVTVKFDHDNAPSVNDEPSFRVSWKIEQRGGSQDGFYVIHKYRADSDEPRGVFLRSA